MSGGTEEKHEKPQDSRSSGPDFNVESPEHEAAVLNTRPKRPVAMSNML
jgi:hypothetical protein